jgi:hypothetical protein
LFEARSVEKLHINQLKLINIPSREAPRGELKAEGAAQVHKANAMTLAMGGKSTTLAKMARVVDLDNVSYG